MLKQHIQQLVPLSDRPRNAFMCLSVSLDSALGTQPSFRCSFPTFAAAVYPCVDKCVCEALEENYKRSAPCCCPGVERVVLHFKPEGTPDTDSSLTSPFHPFPSLLLCTQTQRFHTVPGQFLICGCLVWSSSLSLAEVEKATNDVLRCAI